MERGFPHPKDPTRPRGTIDRSWRRLRLAAGLPETLRLHDLRHTYASQALLQGETLANHCTVIVLGQNRMNAPPFAPASVQ